MGETEGERWIGNTDEAVAYFEDQESWIPVISGVRPGKTNRNIDAIGYHESEFLVTYERGRRVVRRVKQGTLGIKFHGNRVYLYPVSRAYFSSMMAASSKGTWFWAHIRRSKIGWYKVGA